MRRTAASTLGLVIATTAMMLVSCANNNQAERAPARSAANLQAHPLACPLAQLRGVRAEAADAPRGVAIVLDGPDRVLDLLRANVQAMATANDSRGDPFQVCPCGARTVLASADAPSAGGSDLGLTSMQAPSPRSVPPSTATVQETPTGATLILSAREDADIEVLRVAARQGVTAMGACLSPSQP